MSALLFVYGIVAFAFVISFIGNEWPVSPAEGLAATVTGLVWPMLAAALVITLLVFAVAGEERVERWLDR